MKGKFDDNTLDAFGTANRRGRPIITTPVLKKKQSADRSRRYRVRQRIINLIARKMATTPDINRDAYLSFMDYLGNSTKDAECHICYEQDCGGLGFETMRFSELVSKFLLLKDIAIVSCEPSK